MSLIHDALRRLQAQRPPRPGGPTSEAPWQLGPPPSGGSRPWAWLGLCLLMAAGAVLLWEWWRTGARRAIPAGEVAGGIPAPKGLDSGSESGVPLLSSSAEVTTAGWDAARMDPAVGSPQRHAAVGNPLSEASASGSEGLAGVQTGGRLAVGSPAPGGLPGPLPEDTSTAAPVRLQAIILHPQRPVAVINQRAVSVGGEIAGWRVERIEPERVILVGYGRTNVLELP
jgi:hypothetical protein